MVVSGSEDSIVRVWDAYEGNHILSLKGHLSVVNSVAWSPEGSKVGSKIASGSDDKTVRVWDAGTGECVKVLDGTTSTLPWACASHPQSIVALRDIAGFERGAEAYISGSIAVCIDQIHKNTIHTLRLRGCAPTSKSTNQ